MKMQVQPQPTPSAPADKTGVKPASIGVNLRVTGHCQQGGRKYMEDYFAVAYQQTDDEKDLEYAFFGIFDGHGGAEAAAFAKEHLMEYIVKDPRFWLDNDEEVLSSIRDGFIDTHHAMWKIHDKWPKTASGLPSTAGTTASVAFIRRGKIYVGHVGDSGITLGYQHPGCADWQAKSLTKDHKPECAHELARIEQSGGKVVAKMGVPRVVWNRPRIGHKGPVRRSTPIDEIPFLAVARSLGDLWSYNAALDEFVVSPKPDVSVHTIDTSTFRCLIFGTDGLYNMLSPQVAVHIVQEAERRNEEATLSSCKPQWINPSKTLVERALDRWCNTKMRADNTSVITLMLDPPGPPRAQVLRSQRMEREKERLGGSMETQTSSQPTEDQPYPKPTDAATFVPKVKLRESTAFDTRPHEPEPTTDTSNLTSNPEPTTDITSNETCESPKPEETPPKTTELQSQENNQTMETPEKGDITSEKDKDKESTGNDIQINEITSSSFDNMDIDTEDEEKRTIRRKSTKKTTPRKFNLRSSHLDDAVTPSTSPTKKTAKDNVDSATTSLDGAKVSLCTRHAKARTPLGENVARDAANPNQGESRVLRERRNTQAPNTSLNHDRIASKMKLSNSTVIEKNEKKEKKVKGKMFKKKAKKMALSTEKKKLLSGLLFKKDQSQGKSTESTSNQPKTKENTKTPPKLTTRRSERHKPAEVGESPREVRKSTLKLRMPEGIFKAKLRAHASTAPSSSGASTKANKLKQKAKGLSLKKYVTS